MLRSIAKDATAKVLSWARFDAIAREHLRLRTPFIVGYHRVVEQVDAHRDFALPAMEISVTMLEKHLDWLGRHFDLISLDDFRIANGRRRSKPIAAVTFDDGYSDVFHNAFPMLKRKGIPAAAFVVTDLIGTTGMLLHDKLFAVLRHARVENPFHETQRVLRTRQHDDVERIIDSLDGGGAISRNAVPALQPMTWDMLASMRDAGMTIGSHSRTHAFLTNETPARVHEEVHESRIALQKQLNVKADLFAYPGGSFNKTVVEAVRAAGYTVAFTDCRHSDDRYPTLTISRRGFWERSCVDRGGRFSPAIMSCHSAALLGRSGRCTDH